MSNDQITAAEWQTVEWETDDDPRRGRHQNWLWRAGVIFAVLILTSVFFKNFLLAIIIGISGASLVWYHRQPAEKIVYTISRQGVRVKDRLYPYHNLRSFWIDDDHPAGRRLILKSDKILSPYLSVWLDREIKTEQLKQYLLAFLEEERHDESLTEIVADYLGL